MSRHALQRGEAQALKRGLKMAREATDALVGLSGQEGRYIVMEIYAGSGTLCRVANTTMSASWKALEPYDVLYGHDLTQRETQRELKAIIEKVEPDLVTLSMPCTPWCSWMYLSRDLDGVEARRAADLPLWRFAREVWDIQTKAGRLVLTENPCNEVQAAVHALWAHFSLNSLET